MIEKAPSLSQHDNDTIALMVDLQLNGELRKIQDEYLYWDKLKYKTKGRKPEEVWKAVKLHRFIKGKRLSFGKHSFSYVITDFMLKSLHEFDLNVGGSLGSNIGIVETNKHRFIINSIMEEAISSSQMEGANTTRKRAKEMIRSEKKPNDRSEKMIYNNYLTMRHIVESKNEKLTAENLLYIHKLITSNTLDDEGDEGSFRSNNDIHVINHATSEIVHMPPPKDELKGLVEDICIFFNEKSNDFIHPIIKGCILHFMIGWVHPFADGNGRTARALFYWYLLKQGYWLTEYLSISRIIQNTKVQYEKAYLYAESDDNDLSYFITYHMKAMEKAYEALKVYIDSKQKEVVRAAKFLKISGVNERMAQILKILSDDPDRTFSIKEVESKFDVSSFTARSDIKELVNKGFLEPIYVDKKKRNYIKSKTFDEIIERL